MTDRQAAEALAEQLHEQNLRDLAMIRDDPGWALAAVQQWRRLSGEVDALSVRLAQAEQALHDREMYAFGLEDKLESAEVRLAQAEQERDEALQQRDHDYARFSEAKRGVIDESKSVMAERDRAKQAEVRLREYEEALKEIDGEARRQHLAWANFHEVAMRDPFEAESEAQDFARLILRLAGR